MNREHIQATNRLEADLLSMSEAAELVPYSAEYLSLLCRKGKLDSRKIRNTWYTTQSALDEYVRRQKIREHIDNGDIEAVAPLVEQQPQINTEGGTPINTDKTQINTDSKPEVRIDANSDDFNPNQLKRVRHYRSDLDDYATRAGFLPQALGLKERKSDQTHLVQSSTAESPDDKERFSPRKNVISALIAASLDDIEGLFGKIGHLPSALGRAGKLERSKQTSRRDHYHAVLKSKMLVGALLVGVVVVSLLPTPVALGFLDRPLAAIRGMVKDADSVLGSRPGTGANEILLLDKEGNVAIMGHIETEGQLRSYVESGIAPIVVDSITEVANLNAEYLGGMHNTEFTLAYITKNGNITTEDVVLEGAVEVGSSLKVRGATELLSALSVGGDLQVFGDAEFAKALRVLGPAYFEGVLTAKDSAKIEGNLSVNKNISVRGGIETGSSIIAKGGGTFRSLSASGGLSAKGKVTLGNEDETITFDAENVTLDESGNAAFDGNVSAFKFGSTDFSTVNATTTNIYFTNGEGDYLTIGDLNLTGSTTLQNFTFVNATGTSATTTNLYSTTASSTNLFASLLTIAGNALYIGEDRRVGIGTTTPNVTLHVDGTDGLVIPVGTTGERPGSPDRGTIRYNTTTSAFEGFSGLAWSSLGGVRDVDQDTYIIAELTPGSDEDTLYFYTNGTEKMTIDPNGLVSLTGGLLANASSTLQDFTFVNATGTQATTTNFFSTRGTFDELYVNDYQQNDGTFVINSTVATGDIFSVTDNAITSGTLIHQSLTAHAGNGQTSYGQIIDLVDSTVAGGGYTALSVNVSGAGVGSGDKYLLSLDPGSNEVVFDSMGAFRPTTSIASNTNTVGSPSYYWKNGYFDTLTANNLSGTVVTGATSNDTWTIGSTETGDALKSLIFQRNSGSGNAAFQWNSGSNDLRFLSVNYPFNATYTVNDSSISTTANLYSGLLTNNTTSGTQRLFSLTNTGTGTTERGIYINNTGTGDTGFELAGEWSTALITSPDSGNVGFGTTTPWARLSVAGVAGSSDPLFTIASSTAGYATSTAFHIDANGNVGIGTASPTEALEITGNLLVTGNSTTTHATTTSIFGTTATFTTLTAGSQTLDDLIFSNATGTSATTTNFYSATASSTNLFSSLLTIAGNALVVDSSRNTGLGTTTPGAKLHSLATTEQLRLGYDASNYTSFTVDSAGDITIAPTGGNLNITGELYLTSSTTLQNFTFTNATGTSATTTNFYSITASSTNLFSTSGNIGILTANTLALTSSTTLQNFTFVNATGTSATTTNFYSTNFDLGTGNIVDLTTDNLILTASTTLQNFTFVNATGTSATTTNFYSTTASSTNLYSSLLTVAGNALVVDSAGKVGIGTDTPSVSLHVAGADGLLIPSGTTGERPGTPTSGTIRYNSTIGSFEGYSGSNWTGLGGVIDVDLDTYILTEASAGSDEDTLYFYTAGTEKVTIDPNGLVTLDNLLATASSTLQNFTFVNATGTSATTTNFYSTTASSTNLYSSLLTIAGNALVVDSSRNTGLGTTTPGAKLHSLSTTEQLRLGYDASNYWSGTVGSTGGLTLAGTGTGGALTLTPTAGQSLNISLSTTGDLIVNTNDLVVDTSSGYVGIGTASPYATLSVDGDVSFNNGSFLHTQSTGVTSIDSIELGATIFESDAGIISWIDMPVTSSSVASTTNSFSAQIDGTSILTVYSEADGLGGLDLYGVGVATTSPWRRFAVDGTVGFENLTGSTGAGSLCLSADNEVVYNSASDSCLPSLRSTKDEITDLEVSALEQVKALKPVSFVYKNMGTATSSTRWGFIAEDTAEVDAPLATYNAKGELSGIDDRAVLALTVKAIQELEAKLSANGQWTMDNGQESSNASSTTEVTDSSGFLDTLGYAGLQIYEGVTGFREVVAEKIVALRGFFEELTTKKLVVEEEFCVDDVCIGKEELKALLLEAGGVRAEQINTDDTQINTDDTATSTEETSTPNTQTSGNTQTSTSTEPVIEETASTTPSVEDSTLNDQTSTSTPDTTTEETSTSPSTDSTSSPQTSSGPSGNTQDSTDTQTSDTTTTTEEVVSEEPVEEPAVEEPTPEPEPELTQ